VEGDRRFGGVYRIQLQVLVIEAVITSEKAGMFLPGNTTQLQNSAIFILTSANTDPGTAMLTCGHGAMLVTSAVDTAEPGVWALCQTDKECTEVRQVTGRFTRNMSCCVVPYCATETGNVVRDASGSKHVVFNWMRKHFSFSAVINTAVLVT
jgi:hypothetical protein